MWLRAFDPNAPVTQEKKLVARNGKVRLTRAPLLS
jgi:hypothetical protein